jgi:uncharacterized protein YndB with AHSA1/START domain
MSNGTTVTESASVEVRVNRIIAASAQQLFEAWTAADQLCKWWGPPGGSCLSADVDARPGGKYRIDNLLADGSVVTIEGVFLKVEAPHLLSYTWRLTSGPVAPELVTVTFTEADGRTEVAVIHQHVTDPAARIEHGRGWVACLDGLDDYVRQ